MMFAIATGWANSAFVQTALSHCGKRNHTGFAPQARALLQ